MQTKAYAAVSQLSYMLLAGQCFESPSEDVTILTDVQFQIVKHDGATTTFTAWGNPATQIMYPVFKGNGPHQSPVAQQQDRVRDKLQMLDAHVTVVLVNNNLTAVHFEGLQAGLNEPPLCK